MSVPEPLNDHELTVLQDREILLIKKKIDRKASALLLQSQKALQSFITSADLSLPKAVSVNQRKIARGENHQDMPYWVSDFPAHFSRTDTWAFRTMVWWGHGLYFSLIIKGHYKKNVQFNLAHSINDDLYYTLGSDPWQTQEHASPEVKLVPQHQEAILAHFEKSDFLRLGTKASLEQINILPELCVISFEKIMKRLRYLA